MASHERLRELGLFDARVPRYTSYPPANHFSGGVDAATVTNWMQQIEPGSQISLYLHIPYCRRLCWFCACRTQGTSTDRPLVPYLDLLKAEIALIKAKLPQDITLSQIHLGGGTPTLLNPQMIAQLGQELQNIRPWEDDLTFSVEIDPTEVDQARIDALVRIGMTRASIGVQDFDPMVQEAIGRIQSYEQTRDVVEMLRGAGIGSLNMDILYGLPHQTRARMTDSVQKILTLNPDRVALYGYAHVPWMAKRQVMIPSDALPDSVARLELFEIARRLFIWDGYREIGIDHYAREGDSMADADRTHALRRNFQGYTDDTSQVLIGLGASAISRYPQGFAQNHSTSSRYSAAIQAGDLATDRGHLMSMDDSLRSAMIEQVMCRFELDYPSLSDRFDVPIPHLRDISAGLVDQFADQIEVGPNGLKIIESPRLIARMVAQALDAYEMPEGRHSRAL